MKKIQKSKSFELFYSGRMKKSQIEMMGFAIIVILLIVGLFLFISFRLMSTARPGIPKSEESFMISFVSAFPQIDERCGQETFKMSDLIQQCALGRMHEECKPCKVMEETAKAILDKTLKKWEIPYCFGITATQEDGLIDFEYCYNCNETSERYAPAVQPISLFDRGVTRDTIEISLARCIVRD